MSEMENLKSQLKKIAQGEGAPVAEPTAQFDSSPEAPVKKEVDPKKQELKKLRENMANMMLAASQKGQAKTSETEKRLRKEVSNRAYVAGYVTQKGPRVDFATKKTKENTYDVAPKQFGPTKILFAIVMVPEGLLNLFSKQNAPDFEDRLDKVLGATDKYQTVYVPWAEFINWMLANTNGTIREADEIFTPYYSKSKRIINPADATNNPQGLPQGNILYISTHQTKDSSKLFVVKNSIRSKILAENNYVALQRYKNMNVGKNYTPEDAARYNAMYLGKLTTTTTKRPQPTVASLSPAATQNITVDPETYKIVASTFFPTSGPSYFDDPAHAIPHWCRKKLENDTVVNDTIAPVLSAKIAKITNKNGVETTTFKFDTEELKGVGATTTTYHCDAATFPGIFSATKHLFSLNDLDEVASTVKTTRVTGTGAKASTRSNLVGSAVINADPNELFAAMSEYASKKSAIDAK